MLVAEGECRRIGCVQHSDDGDFRLLNVPVRRAYQRGVIDKQHAAIVIIERAARVLVRRPVRMLDARGVIVVVVIGAQMDVRRRQQCRNDGRSHHKRGSKRPAESGRNHAEILSQ